MNMERRAQFSSTDVNPNFYPNYVVLDQANGDEISLVDLVRNIAREWKTLVSVLILGALVSIAAAFHLSRTYEVESVLRIPTIHELGEAGRQRLLEIEPSDAFRIFAEQVVKPETHKATLTGTVLGEKLSRNGELSELEIVDALTEAFSVNVISQDFYQLAKTEKAPLRQIRLSLRLQDPELAASYLQELIQKAQELTVAQFSADIVEVKANRIEIISEQLNTLAMAGKHSRLAEIARLEEANRAKVAKLEQQIELKLVTAAKNREHSIARLDEALRTATDLNIVEPVSWDDLRPPRESSQITNEIGETAKSEPLYFQGSRLLRAELDRLQSRKTDRPFVDGINELELEIELARNDPALQALKIRADDTIYIEKYDELQRQLSELIEQNTQFDNSRFAIVSQAASIPRSPTRDPILVFTAGMMVWAFIALIVALLVSVFRADESKRPSVAPVD